MSREAPLVSELPLALAELGGIGFRNNCGACYTQTGRMIRYGLANDSKAANKVMKSSDIISIQPRLITLADVGKTIGQFGSWEAKKPGWVYKGTDREVAQKNWLDLVIRFGGVGGFITDVGGLK